MSAPPPDVIPPVQVVGPAAATSAALDQSHAPDGRRLQISRPPPDIIPPVQVVSETPAAGASRAQAGGAPADLLLPRKEGDYDEVIGDAVDPEQDSGAAGATVLLDTQEIYRIVRAVAVADSGEDLYSAISADAEYNTPGHPAYGQAHYGLGFGLVLFQQAAGRLGAVLRLMQARDPALFADIFDPGAGELLATTNAATPQDRLKPVGGELLWSAGWVERFRKAGAVPAFQAAQNEEAIEGQFRPMLNIAFNLGFVTDRGLAMVYDRVVTRGLGGGLRWVVQAAGPLRTAAQREQALALLGFDDVLQFQNAAGWTPQTGRLGPETHAALVGALRRQGAISLPTSDDLAGRLVAAAAGPARTRLLRLRDLPAFSDTVYRLG
jgi:hypothetical protein